MEAFLELEKFLIKIDDKTKEFLHDRKENKLNFNFFTALVSGKSSKEHIEKYHTNFIAYLLDPNGGHDFGDVFLILFLNEAKIKIPISNIEIEREYYIENNRIIDIVIKQGQDIPIFIENKITSGELLDQLKDYFQYTEHLNNQYGIYLSLDGRKPNNYKKNNTKLICLSYHSIIAWIDKCMLEVQNYSQITNIFRQYKEVVQSLLNISCMEKLNQDLFKNNKIISHFIAKHHLQIQSLLRIHINEIKDRFLKELKIKLEESFLKDGNSMNVFLEIPDKDNKGHSIVLKKGDLFFSGDEGKSFGMGFQLYLNEIPQIFIGATGFGYNGGCSGSELKINNLNAHYGIDIDNTNAYLSDAYDDLLKNQSQKWEEYLNENVNWINENKKNFNL